MPVEIRRFWVMPHLWIETEFTPGETITVKRGNIVTEVTASADGTIRAESVMWPTKQRPEMTQLEGEKK